MQGTGEAIGKALETFTDAIFGDLVSRVTGPDFTKADRYWCTWMNESYPATMKALLKLEHYFGTGPSARKAADAYICGYYRGLQEAAWRLREQTLATKRRAQPKHRH
jgi:hypothetical protein